VHCHGAALPDSVPVAHWHGVLGMGTWQYGTGMVQLDVWCGSAALPRAVTSCHVPLWHCHKIDRAIAALELRPIISAEKVELVPPRHTAGTMPGGAGSVAQWQNP
jgi:hypothetical protein